MVLEKTLERPLDCKEIKLVNPKGNHPWIFTGRTDTEAPKLWPSDGKSWLIRKDPDAGNDWRQEEKQVIQYEMVRQHHQLNGHDFEQTPGDSKGQRNLMGYSPSGFKELQTVGYNLVTEQQQQACQNWIIWLSGNSSIRPVAPKHHIFQAFLCRHYWQSKDYVPGTCYTWFMEKQTKHKTPSLKLLF